MSPDVRIGISGWTYKPWRGTFYPKDLPHKKELAYAASIFRSIEINGTFYSMHRCDSFAHWAEETPHDFIFAAKVPGYLTHMLKLRNAEAPLGNFFASGLLRQFPSNFRFNADRLETFFALLPHDTEAAAECGRRHDHRLKGKAWLKRGARRRIRHAMEIRHESFHRDAGRRGSRRGATASRRPTVSSPARARPGAASAKSTSISTTPTSCRRRETAGR